MVDHAHMPGMDHTAKKPAEVKPPAAPKKAVEAKHADAPAPADKAKSQGKPGKS